MTLKFVNFTGSENFRKLVFRATNHTNKEVETLDLEFKFLDASEKVLKEMPFGGYSGKRIAAGDELESEHAAFFMTEGTKSVEATVSEIEFSDASQWKKTREQRPRLDGYCRKIYRSCRC